tara:strand:- start:387 stop:1157 length:771 start_codon:yes stop_codon:yes gene_type:complete
MINIMKFASFGENLADLVRPLLINAYQMGSGYEKKEDGSVVTSVDRDVEKLIRSQINKTFPNHGILGEEFENERLGSDFIWVVDPIDGTRAFATGIPNFGCLISLCFEGKPILGIIEVPLAGLRAVGVIGHPTLVNGRKVNTKECIDLKDAVLSTCHPGALRERRNVLDTLREKTSWRFYDGGCVSYVSLVRGFLDICIDGNLDPYDFCALVPVVEGAGGKITDWSGKALDINSGSRIVASGTPLLHDSVLYHLSS